MTLYFQVQFLKIKGTENTKSNKKFTEKKREKEKSIITGKKEKKKKKIRTREGNTRKTLDKKRI